MKKCPVCESSMSKSFSARMLKKYDVNYFFCGACGLLQTEQPYWLEEAYLSAIATADTGLVQRNISIASKLSSTLFYEFDPMGNYIDVAGGYGMLVRMMRDTGFNFYWDDKYCQNLLAQGFEKKNLQGKVAAVTAFEVLEHLHDPVTFIANTLAENDSTTLIFTTELFNDTPPPSEWWYYAFETGQHISFYQPKTLHFIANKLGLKFYSANGLHILTKKNINTIKFNLITGKYGFLFRKRMRRHMISLTLTDHNNIMQSNNSL